MTNDAQESATHEWIVERNGDGSGCSLLLQLHNSVTAALAHGDKSALSEYLAGFSTGEDPQFTQRAPQPE